MLRSKRLKRAESGHNSGTPQSRLAQYLREIIYGGVDGIITTFAVVAGFSGAALSGEATTQLSLMVVLLFGLTNLFGDGVSLGLGNFLAVRSEQGLYKNIWRREQSVSEENGKEEAHETHRALMSQGFSESDAHTLTQIYRKNEAFWLDFIISHELKVTNPMSESAVYTGLATFCSFTAFGLIPLAPFIVFRSVDPETLFQLSASGAIVALFMLGIFKWKVVGTQLARSVFEVVLVGGLAATVAFGVGTLFSL